MSSLLSEDAPRPRLCHLKKIPNFQGYGFNLHAEKGKAGQYIGKVDDDSPAEAAGLKTGDRIVEVNGTNIGNENHQQVVQRIKAVPDETKLLVVDQEADQYYKEKKIVVRGDMPGVLLGGTNRLATEETQTQTVTAQVNHEPSPPTVNGDAHVSQEDAKIEEVAAVAAVAAVAIEEEKKQENQAQSAQVVVNGEAGTEVTVVTQDGGQVSHFHVEAETPPPSELEAPPPPPPTYEQEEVTVAAEVPAADVVPEEAATTVTTVSTAETKVDGEVVSVEKKVESVSTDQGTVQVETTTVNVDSPTQSASETTTVVTTTEAVAPPAEPELKVETTSAETEAEVAAAAVTTAAAVEASTPPPAEPTPVAQPESPKAHDPNDPFGVSAAEMRERLKGRRSKKQEVKAANLSTIDKYQMYQRL